jgi:hypothetical protein
VIIHEAEVFAQAVNTIDHDRWTSVVLPGTFPS